MIVGMGIDIVRTDRMERIRQRFGQRFAQRILSADEYSDWIRTGETSAFLARRFAVKEAAAKALGTGFRDGIRFHQVATLHDGLGAPGLRLTGAAALRLQQLEASRHHVSISDDRGLAIACVILESER